MAGIDPIVGPFPRHWECVANPGDLPDCHCGSPDCPECRGAAWRCPRCGGARSRPEELEDDGMCWTCESRRRFRREEVES